MSARRDPAPGTPPGQDELVRKHLRVGWWALLVFLTLGIALEVMHGFKVDLYLSVANETRRLMWRLGHAHGALLALVNVAFAVTVRAAGVVPAAWTRWASLCLVLATALLPGGFLLGGAVIHGGDPGKGVLLVPVGALLLFAGVLLTALRAPARR